MTCKKGYGKLVFVNLFITWLNFNHCVFSKLLQTVRQSIKVAESAPIEDKCGLNMSGLPTPPVWTEEKYQFIMKWIQVAKDEDLYAFPKAEYAFIIQTLFYFLIPTNSTSLISPYSLNLTLKYFYLIFENILNYSCPLYLTYCISLNFWKHL
jgi:hypothetical protein